MKINVLVFILSCFYMGLSAQIDKVAITKGFINGWGGDAQEIEKLKKHFSPNLVFTWPTGGNWPDGSEGSLDEFWSFYINHRENWEHKMTNFDVKVVDNETYALFTWESTPLKDEEHPEWVGNKAVGPAFYKITWEGTQIKHLQFIADFKSREAQHANVSDND